jgi:hypothetical protein
MDGLRRAVRQAKGRESSPSSACIACKTVKGREVGGERLRPSRFSMPAHTEARPPEGIQACPLSRGA